MTGLPAATVDNLTGAQAGAIASGLSGAALTSFLGGLTAATKNDAGFAKGLSVTAAEAAVAGLSGTALKGFFDSLSSTAQTAVLES